MSGRQYSQVGRGGGESTGDSHEIQMQKTDEKATGGVSVATIALAVGIIGLVLGAIAVNWWLTKKTVPLPGWTTVQKNVTVGGCGTGVLRVVTSRMDYMRYVSMLGLVNITTGGIFEVGIALPAGTIDAVDLPWFDASIDVVIDYTCWLKTYRSPFVYQMTAYIFPDGSMQFFNTWVTNVTGEGNPTVGIVQGVSFDGTAIPVTFIGFEGTRSVFLVFAAMLAVKPYRISLFDLVVPSSPLC
jgi:hypothetical protein